MKSNFSNALVYMVMNLKSGGNASVSASEAAGNTSSNTAQDYNSGHHDQCDLPSLGIAVASVE